jgi:hypothetical protein
MLFSIFLPMEDILHTNHRPQQLVVLLSQFILLQVVKLLLARQVVYSAI